MSSAGSSKANKEVKSSSQLGYLPPRKSHWHPMRLIFHTLSARGFKLGIHETQRRKSMHLLRVFYHLIL